MKTELLLLPEDGASLTLSARSTPEIALGQTSSDRLACLAAARLAVRRSLSVFCGGFFPSFLGFCEPFTCILLVGRARRRS